MDVQTNRARNVYNTAIKKYVAEMNIWAFLWRTNLIFDLDVQITDSENKHNNNNNNNMYFMQSCEEQHKFSTVELMESSEKVPVLKDWKGLL
jgi:hypothetical protein